MATMREWYARANLEWPQDLPIPTEQQAINAARRLWKWGVGYKWDGKVAVTSGRRYTWIKRGVLVVNPNRRGWEHQGWKALVHDLSHLLWRRANRGEKVRPHERGHAKLELRMVKEVIKRGWLEPTAK